MGRYLIRLDDASDYMDIENWKRMERLLDKFSIKPIFGIIPNNKDPEMLSKYDHNLGFWNLVNVWIGKGWTAALHGYEHLYVTREGGLNPVNDRSEFAGLPYEIQAEKIKKGWEILKEHGIDPKIFFAPAHTFDENTLKAIKEVVNIRIISDTIANDIYKEGDFYFIPQQSGRVRKLPFKTITFCYHPNTMEDMDYERLEGFLIKNYKKFVGFETLLWGKHKFGIDDWIVRKIYFFRKCRDGKNGIRK